MNNKQPPWRNIHWINTPTN